MTRRAAVVSGLGYGLAWGRNARTSRGRSLSLGGRSGRVPPAPTLKKRGTWTKGLSQGRELETLLYLHPLLQQLELQSSKCRISL
jgi:hypothetical protein